MKLAGEVITVFNRYRDIESDYDMWVSTVISGVSYFSQVKTSFGDKGLQSAQTVTIRVPADADCREKTLVTPAAFTAAEDKSGPPFQMGV